MTAAKRWVPLLCSHTGARVAEITQLRKLDVKIQDGTPYIRISPEAGSVKTHEYRDVPLHAQLVERGFLQFVADATDGALFFHDNPKRSGATHPSKFVAGRVSQWLQSEALVPKDVSPNHGWRHAFKTFGIEAGIEVRVLDAIQGHAPRTAGEAYGGVSLAAKAKAVACLPAYDLALR